LRLLAQVGDWRQAAIVLDLLNLEQRAVIRRIHSVRRPIHAFEGQQLAARGGGDGTETVVGAVRFMAAAGFR
jgi:hypothetical protein